MRNTHNFKLKLDGDQWEVFVKLVEQYEKVLNLRVSKHAVAKQAFEMGMDMIRRDVIEAAMPKEDSAQWFGVAPPDLTLVARVRGVDWLYTYLQGFYDDPKRPWGVNNAVFPDVGMPHVLQPLQGRQVALTKTEKVGAESRSRVVGLELVEPGELSPKEYKAVVADIVNFLDYVAEPIKLERRRLGVWVLCFVFIFTILAYLLKREYWKDVD